MRYVFTNRRNSVGYLPYPVGRSIGPNKTVTVDAPAGLLELADGLSRTNKWQELIDTGNITVATSESNVSPELGTATLQSVADLASKDFVVVPTYNDLATIPVADRFEGMVAYTFQETSMYVLGAGLGDFDWFPIEFGEITINDRIRLGSSGLAIYNSGDAEFNSIYNAAGFETYGDVSLGVGADVSAVTGFFADPGSVKYVLKNHEGIGSGEVVFTGGYTTPDGLLNTAGSIRTSATATFTVEVTFTASDGSGRASFKKFAMFRNAGGTLLQIGATADMVTPIQPGGASGWTATIDCSTDFIILPVQSDTGVNWAWTARIQTVAE